MSKRKIDDLIRFVAFTQDFQNIERVILKRGAENKWESDAEHSWQLAIVAWYIIQKENLSLDLHKVLQFALVHDLVEVYAGDTYIYGTEEQKNSKHERESIATKKIKEEFPDFPTMSSLIEEYERRDCDECKFVYALDKLLPVIYLYIDNGRFWRSNGVTYKMARDAKDSKISISPEIQSYWEEFIQILEVHKKHIFAE